MSEEMVPGSQFKSLVEQECVPIAYRGGMDVYGGLGLESG